MRRLESLVAKYAQRYCAKNERAGFFGPDSPARWTESADPLRVRPGPHLVARRSVVLEPWAIDALLDRLSEDPELRPSVAPRRMPNLRLDGTTLHVGGRTTTLPAEFARALAACTGSTPAGEMAATLAADPTLGLGGPDEVYDLLDELAAKQLIVWRLDVPTSGPAAQLARAELQRLAAGDARDRAAAVLDDIERARDAVAAAAGADQLDTAMADLERLFEDRAGTSAVRQSGQTYAGRTIVALDCVRDVEVELGRPLFERLAPPLRLVLHSARWFTHTIAARYRDALREVRDRFPGPEVDYTSFQAALPALFPGPQDERSIVRQVATDLASRWWTLLGSPGDERVVELSAASLEERVAEAFAAPGPGWPTARHHSPDLLVAGDPDAIGAGNALLVLGELHVGMNTLLMPGVPSALGLADAIVEQRDAEVGRPGIAPVWTRARTRMDYYSPSPADHDLERGAERSRRPPAQVVAIADLVLRDVAGHLRVETRDRRRSWDLIAFLEHHLIAEAHSAFRLLPRRPHTPRIVLDGVVLARESWHLPAADIAFTRASDPVERFAMARAWAASLNLPRHVFAKVPEEVKPLYVDLESPLYIDLAARVLQSASSVTLSEMLPNFEQLWLEDASGQRYTSELRLVAVDPVPWLDPLRPDAT